MPAKITVLVADDEPLARRGVRQLLAPHGDMMVAGECRNGHETLRALEELTPDLLFLDVRMPEMDGFAVVRARGVEQMPAVVFVTAHDEFAVRAFEAHAVDYLVKPLHVERFETALQKVRDRLRMTEALERATRLSALLAARSSGVERLVIPSATSNLVIPVAEINWISADDYYSRLHVGTRSHLLRESLSSLEARLDTRQFVRVHRSAIVRVSRVREVRRTLRGGEVVLVDGTCVPMSRRKRGMLEELLRG